MKYEITIQAIITKTIVVDDPEGTMTENEAVEAAHSSFTATNDGDEEKYCEDTLDIKKIL
jgi:hypothetical protein